ncbi:MAG: hypothetical protein VXZ86_05815, partial [Bacteroidota bacterium]|nr:hypothetical protein [Bacteroidota bacterium]
MPYLNDSTKWLRLALLTACWPALLSTQVLSADVSMRVDSTWSQYSSGELFLEGNILMEEEFWHEAE